jgi:hypothetical protein
MNDLQGFTQSGDHRRAGSCEGRWAADGLAGLLAGPVPIRAVQLRGARVRDGSRASCSARAVA